MATIATRLQITYTCCEVGTILDGRTMMYQRGKRDATKSQAHFARRLNRQLVRSYFFPTGRIVKLMAGIGTLFPVIGGTTLGKVLLTEAISGQGRASNESALP